MMKKYMPGDIFEVDCSTGVRYFQYLMDDTSQLGSNVVAVFSRKYVKSDEAVDWCAVTSEAVEFFAHISISLGAKLKIWRKVASGPTRSVGRILFRDTPDYGQPNVVSSDDWWVWHPNEPARHVGPLKGELRRSFIGVVIAPQNILSRLETGKYSYSYPIPRGEGEYCE